jgi:AcrR family transcriptional regulator
MLTWLASQDIGPNAHRTNIGDIGRMSHPVNSRRAYRSEVREDQAQRTRAAVLEAARALFAAKGFTATTVAAIAKDAGVAVDTVYAAVGSKPQLLRTLIETAVSGANRPLPPDQRAWVHEIRAAPTAREKLQLYARTVREMHGRMGPLLLILREAAEQSDELAELASTLRTRGAANMRRFAGEVASTGELRPDLTVDEMADVVWATNSVEFYSLLIGERGWTPEQYEAWLSDSWARLFLSNDARSASSI